jgi:tetratricopeptide (TPR) repeat protein
VASARRQHARALSLSSEALVIQRDLTQRVPADFAAGWRLASMLGSAGQIANLAGDLGKAEALFRERLDRVERLRSVHPDPASADFEVSIALAQLGWAARAQGKFAEAVKWHEAGIKRCRELVNSQRNRAPLSATCLSGTLRDLGFIQIEIQDFSSAKATFVNALELFEGPGALDVRDPGNAQIHALSLLGLAETLNALKEPKDALAAADTLVGIARESTRQRPGEGYSARLLAAALQHRAEALRQAGQIQDAKRAIDESLMLRRSVLPGGGAEAYEAAITLEVASRIALALGDAPTSESLRAEGVRFVERAMASRELQWSGAPSRLASRLSTAASVGGASTR